MDRRELICSTIASICLTGCQSSSGSQSAQHKIKAITPDNIADSRNVRLEIEQTQEISATTPGRIEITLTNTADHERTFEFGPVPPFTPPIGKNEGATATLVLVPDSRTHVVPKTPSRTGDSFVPENPTDGCWRAKTQMGRESVSERRTLDPNERIREQYTLLATPKEHSDDSCMPPGEYRFVQQGYFDDGAFWGFTVEITGVS